MKSGVGTPLYMKVDIYSFSLIAYEIITGNEPTVESNFLTFMNNIVKGKRPDLSIIRNPKIRKFLEKCWSNDPNERPSFDQIIETLCNRDFYSSFEFDVDEVIDYINLFHSDHPVLKKFLEQLENTSNDEPQSVEDSTVKLKHHYLPEGITIKISVIGYSSIGNTFLIRSYVDPDFDGVTKPTIGNGFYYKTLNTKHGNADLCIWDAKVSEYDERMHYDGYKSDILKKSHSVILTIPADEVLDLGRFQFFIDMVENSRNGKPVFLVALRCDLEWKLDDKEIDEIVTKYNYNFFKTSALKHENVSLVFEQITEAVIQKCLEGFYDNDKDLNPYKDNDIDKTDIVNNGKATIFNNDKKCLIY